MLASLKQFWQYISFLGIDEDDKSQDNDRVIRVFFNKCLAIGFFGYIAQVPNTYVFIGNYAFLNLVGALVILSSLFIQAKGYFNIAKRVAVYGVFIVGFMLEIVSGGDFLYHVGVITILTFAWIVFDPKTELLELILFLLLTFIMYFIGEFNPFNAPDFSAMAETKSTRVVVLIIYSALVSVFIYFIRKLNIDDSAKLSAVLAEKELLLKRNTQKSTQLQKERNALESMVSSRTEELRLKTEVLEKQNKEKEVLLKEVHHRVKNNLQIIVSLLNFQSSETTDEGLLLSIKEMQNRIITMSLVHQRIYENSSFAAVEFKEYVNILFKNNRSLFRGKDVDAKLNNNTAENLSIDVDTAIPLGLIINEMLTNSFKHAFPSNVGENELSIVLSLTKNGVFKLVYKDNGQGLPENFEIVNSSTLGIQLIEALASQINGKLKYYNNDGAVFEIVFSGKL